jgi:hypothetical protein
MFFQLDEEETGLSNKLEEGDRELRRRKELLFAEEEGLMHMKTNPRYKDTPGLKTNPRFKDQRPTPGIQTNPR